MSLEYLYISRIADGLVLVASLEQANQNPSVASSLGQGSSSSLRARNMVGASIPSKDIREGRELLLQLTSSSPQRCSVDGEVYTYHYAISGPVVCFAATDRSYPKKLAFCYLEEVRRTFWEHLQREHPQQDPARVISAVERPYSFMKFDRELRNLRKDFSDPNSRKNMQRLQDNLNEIQNIMRKNIDDLVQRGAALDDIKSVSDKLHQDSKTLVWGAKKLNYMAMLRRYGPIAGVSFFVLFFLWLRFYIMI